MRHIDANRGTRALQTRFRDKGQYLSMVGAHARVYDQLTLTVTGQAVVYIEKKYIVYYSDNWISIFYDSSFLSSFVYL